MIGGVDPKSKIQTTESRITDRMRDNYSERFHLFRGTTSVMITSELRPYEKKGRRHIHEKSAFLRQLDVVEKTFERLGGQSS